MGSFRTNLPGALRNSALAELFSFLLVSASVCYEALQTVGGAVIPEDSAVQTTLITLYFFLFPFFLFLKMGLFSYTLWLLTFFFFSFWVGEIGARNLN